MPVLCAVVLLIVVLSLLLVVLSSEAHDCSVLSAAAASGTGSVNMTAAGVLVAAVLK
jgi:hypothetical protein